MQKKINASCPIEAGQNTMDGKKNITKAAALCCPAGNAIQKARKNKYWPQNERPAKINISAWNDGPTTKTIQLVSEIMKLVSQRGRRTVHSPVIENLLAIRHPEAK